MLPEAVGIGVGVMLDDPPQDGKLGFRVGSVFSQPLPLLPLPQPAASNIAAVAITDKNNLDLQIVLFMLSPLLCSFCNSVILIKINQ
jgi:hypothetical protein